MMKILPHNFSEKLVYAASMATSYWIKRKQQPNQIAVKKILCVKWDEIGDLCYALHVFDLLKARYPECKITLVCKPYCNALVAHHPSIDQLVNSFSVLDQHYDLIVDLRGTWESIFFAWKRKPLLRMDRGTVRFRNKQKGAHPHEVYTNLEIIAPLLQSVPAEPKPHIYAGVEAKDYVAGWLSERNIYRFAMIHPGARKELRRWKPANFAQLALWLHQEHQLTILFTGDGSEKELIETIQHQLPFETHSLAGVADLSELAACMQLASLYVGNESGPLCMASVSGVPSLGLFGPGEPTVFYPYGDHTAYVHVVLDCNPCDQIHCVHPNNTCMDRIGMMEVKQKIEELLQNKSI